MSHKYKRLMVSADDFGISQLANDNILILAKLGKLDRVAVMTNGTFSSDEIEALKKTGVALDLHLDLASHIPTKRTFKSGILLRTTNFLLRHLHDRIDPQKKHKHFQQQLEKFNEILGQNPDGLNSHQHIHFFPFYFEIATCIAKENNIDFIRFGTKEISENPHKIRQILSWLRKINLPVFCSSAINSSDYIISLDWIKNIQQFLAYLPEGTTEIVCHPERPEEFEIIKKYF